MKPEVIVHNLRQAKAALMAGNEAGCEIQLKSAPGAAAYAGVGYLQALGEAAGQALIVDCDEDAGLVMAALRAGCLRLAFSGLDDTWHRLSQMASSKGAEIRGPMDQSPPCLALSPEDDGTVIRSWIRSKPEV